MERRDPGRALRRSEVSEKNLSGFLGVLSRGPEAAWRYSASQAFPSPGPCWIPSALRGEVNRRGPPGCAFLMGAMLGLTGNANTQAFLCGTCANTAGSWRPKS